MTLSEHNSKELLREYAVPFAREENVDDASAAIAAATALGYPVVLKLCGDSMAHKPERELVRLGLADQASVGGAATARRAQTAPEGGKV